MCNRITAILTPPEALHPLHQIECFDISGAGEVRKTEDRTFSCGSGILCRPQNNDDQVPPAHKTVLVFIDPNSVRTEQTRPASVSNPKTAQFVNILAPKLFAPLANAVVALLGSAFPSLGVRRAANHPPLLFGMYF